MAGTSHSLAARTPQGHVAKRDHLTTAHASIGNTKSTESETAPAHITTEAITAQKEPQQTDHALQIAGVVGRASCTPPGSLQMQKGTLQTRDQHGRLQTLGPRLQLGLTEGVLVGATSSLVAGLAEAEALTASKDGVRACKTHK